MAQFRSTAEFSGARVLGGKHGTRRIGKVLRAVFFPDGLRLAGYLVKRPDLLFMFKRADRFFAWDSFKTVDGRVVVSSGSDSWDKKACARLGLDWQSAVILQGMPVTTSDGDQIGRVDEVEYDAASGKTRELLLSSGLGGKALIGQMRLAAADVAQVGEAGLRLRAGAETSGFEGGLAAKAGEQAAIVGNYVKDKADAAGKAVDEITDRAGQGIEELGSKAGQAIGDAKRRLQGSGGGKRKGKDNDGLLDSGSKAVGRQLGRSRGMFKSFKDEYDKASKG